MNKSTIKNFAIWARDELIANVSQKAFEYGVSKEEILEQNSESIHGKVLSSEEKEQRQVLIKKVNEKGFDQVIEEVAYTWFNRFIALRYMEVNNYLPNKIRVFTNERSEFDPEILKEALNLDIKGLNKEYIYDCIQNNKREELYKYLLITTCNDMGNYLPGMFTKISDYKVLLFPDNLLRDESVLAKLISEIDEDAWLDQVQIIGWLYQYYNTEPKANVYARPKGSKISKYDIPAVTQLFTPDWIVKYMVENSLGRLWLEGHENNALKENWRYYLEEAKQEESVQKQLDEIRLNRRNQKIEEVTVIDPCMGSGHILVYAFDVLMQIYESEGWTQRDAAISILENNLYGLDIDERAYQISYFALMMKARSYNRRVLSKGIKPHVYQIQASNNLPMQNLEFAIKDEVILKDIETLIHEMTDADEYGSLLTTSKLDYEAIYNYCETHRDGLFGLFVENQLLPFIRCAELLSRKYDITVTNPPYMPPTDKQKAFAIKNYPNAKTDMFAIMMERGLIFSQKYGFSCMVTMQSWMFLSSYEKMRENLIKNYSIANLMQMENMVMGIAFGTAVSNILNVKLNEYKGTYNYIKLSDIQNDVPFEFPVRENRFAQISATNFSKIPRSPIAYWASNRLIDSFEQGEKLANKCETKKGLVTSDNNRFLRLWHEVSINNLSFFTKSNEETKKIHFKWYPLNKGGEFRRWYGNRDHVINWKNDGYEIRNFRDKKGKLLSRPQNTQYNFRNALTWSKITSGTFSARYSEGGFLFDDAAAICYHPEKITLFYVLGYLNSKCCQMTLNVLNPTINIQIGDIGNLSLLEEKKDKVIDLVKKNIDLSKQDWDSFETSWDFTAHPLVKNQVSSIKEAYSLWNIECNERFNTLKANEEELNRIFIDIYGLNDELDPYVEDKDVTVRKADLTKDIKSLISYAVGCMFGRYSLDVDGLAYAGGDFDWSKYSKFIPDKDNIIPISDDEYFEDDIVARFIDFIKVVYGEDTLEENLDFIATALGGKGTSREVIRNYFLNEFYKDHCKIYQKRPIYWMFDSGKKNGFKCLVYMHRYQPDLVARIRTDYVHNTQSRLNYSIDTLEGQLDHVSTSERVRMNKEIIRLKGQADEVRKYEEIVHHYADMMLSIDLDDGVKVNYEKFKDLLAKIK
ncbi:BREX-1 system adenine-specific DNA-methyltransferase PglX [Allobaculum stercoricanis]|uniref:BREX-1 system adenine-specific DNA-methyltransferase PglX n=1 Tax=Allobaculum stercoricanis TaxID=174709 RepID=UPI0003632634|nr:BREX-1 system adenine-specific DNA-methyltransferase PglX [Allobaculum stercoricanis]